MNRRDSKKISKQLARVESTLVKIQVSSRCNFPLNATIRFSMLFSKFPRGLSESIDRKHDLHR